MAFHEQANTITQTRHTIAGPDRQSHFGIGSGIGATTASAVQTSWHEATAASTAFSADIPNMPPLPPSLAGTRDGEKRAMEVGSASASSIQTVGRGDARSRRNNRSSSPARPISSSYSPLRKPLPSRSSEHRPARAVSGVGSFSPSGSGTASTSSIYLQQQQQQEQQQRERRSLSTGRRGGGGGGKSPSRTNSVSTGPTRRKSLDGKGSMKLTPSSLPSPSLSSSSPTPSSSSSSSFSSSSSCNEHAATARAARAEDRGKAAAGGGSGGDAQALLSPRLSGPNTSPRHSSRYK